MSSTLKWEPIVETGRPLSDDLKYLLRKRYGGTVYNVTLDEDQISYLEGLKDASNDKRVCKEIQLLIDAINKHENIKLWEYD